MNSLKENYFVFGDCNILTFGVSFIHLSGSQHIFLEFVQRNTAMPMWAES